MQREEIRSDPKGWLSMALIGACAIAYDKGMKREVESDYIPNWIVKGDFEGLELVV
ncbi:MAG: immunity 49 family protein [Raineya sp.]|nr:immunity 49 family protein [Raineya sp.]